MTFSSPAPPSAQVVAHMRVGVHNDGPLRELASGIDALYLSARAILGPTLLERLEDRRRWADQIRIPVPCELGEEYLGMAPHAWGRYRYCLDHALARVGLTTSEHVPTVRVQPRAEALHSLGPSGTVDAVSRLLGPELGTLSWRVSRVDVFSDWQGWKLQASDASRFVCRADTRRTFEVAGRLTGFTFGSRTTKTISARLYDKTADVGAKGTTWWVELWGDDYDETEPVWRLEFECAREALGQFGLSGVDEVLAAAGDIWTYATGDWLTERTPTADRTHSRWPLAPEWLAVHQATLCQRRIGAERIASARRTASIAKIVPGLTGYLASLAALIGSDGIDDTVIAATPHLRDYEALTRIPFVERVERKRAALGPR